VDPTTRGIDPSGLALEIVCKLADELQNMTSESSKCQGHYLRIISLISASSDYLESFIHSSGALVFFFRFLLLAYSGLLSSSSKEAITTTLQRLIYIFLDYDIKPVIDGVVTIPEDVQNVYSHTASSASLRLDLGERLINAVRDNNTKKFKAALKILNKR
jgi:hypothetical protein